MKCPLWSISKDGKLKSVHLEGLEPLALEHQAWRAVATGQGADFYSRIMTEDARIFLPHTYFTRPSAALEQWTRSLTCSTFRFLSEDVFAVTSSITFVTYEIVIGQAELSRHLHCSTLYVRQEPGWRMSLHQRWSADPAGL